MGSELLSGVQKLLHLDVNYPQFPSYHQHFEFMVDHVLIKAVADVRWRSISIKITEPFQIHAWCHYPPSFAIEYSSVRRKEVLKSKGISEIEDFIEHTKIAYHRHVTYLRLKSKIDAAQSPIVNKHRAELLRLQSIHETVRARVAIRKIELRQQFKANLIDQKPYQSEIKALKKEEFEALCAHLSLKRKIEMKLDEIKNQMINDQPGVTKVV